MLSPPSTGVGFKVDAYVSFQLFLGEGPQAMLAVPRTFFRRGWTASTDASRFAAMVAADGFQSTLFTEYLRDDWTVRMILADT